MNNPQASFLEFSRNHVLIDKKTLAVNVINMRISIKIIAELTKKSRGDVSHWIAFEASEEIKEMSDDQLIQIADQLIADCLKIDERYPVNLSNNTPPDDAV